MSSEYHTLRGEWRIDGIPEDCIIRSSQLRESNILGKPQVVDFLSIAYKEYNSLTEKPRYDKADINEYGIVVRNMPNPQGKAYRLIEGKHRLYKLKDSGFNGAKFYVVDYKDIKPWVYSTVKDEYLFRSKFKGQNYLIALFVFIFIGLIVWRFHRSKRIQGHELQPLGMNLHYTKRVEIPYQD